MTTQRSQADLNTLFADNSTRLITPARLRDLVESCVPSRALMHLAAAATVIATPATAVKALNTSTLDGAYRFTMPADNRLTYSGPADATVHLAATLALKAAVNGHIIAVGFAVNGTIVSETVMRVTAAIGADLTPLSLLASLDLEAGDYVEVFIANDSAASNVTIDHGHVHAIAFLT